MIAVLLLAIVGALLQPPALDPTPPEIYVCYSGACA